jgi:hypothetical protein
MVAQSKLEEKAKEEAPGTPEARLQEVAGVQSTQQPWPREPTQSALEQRAATAPAALLTTPASGDSFGQEKVRRLTKGTTVKIRGPVHEARLMSKLTDLLHKKKAKAYTESTVKATPTRMLQDTFDDVSTVKKKW